METDSIDDPQVGGEHGEHAGEEASAFSTPDEAHDDSANVDGEPHEEAPKRRGRSSHAFAVSLAILGVTCAIAGAAAHVGPPLARMAERGLLSGTVPNTRENLVAWLRGPQRIHGDSAMPDLGLTERDARDIAAYLATLR